VGHGHDGHAEREPTPVATAYILPFAERTVAVADSLLPGEAALVGHRGGKEKEEEEDDDNGNRDLHTKIVASNVAAVSELLSPMSSCRTRVSWGAMIEGDAVEAGIDLHHLFR
jgi:hypothetical protein